MDFPRNEYIALRAFLPLLYTEEGTNEAVTAWLQNATGRKTLRNSLRTLLVTVEASFPDSFPLLLASPLQKECTNDHGFLC